MMTAAPHARLMPRGRPVVDSATVEKGNRLACWLWSHGHFDVDYIPFGYRGTAEVARRFVSILNDVERVCACEGRPCDAELIPCLRGLEGRRVLLAFEEGRRARCLIGRQRYGVLVVHVAKQHEWDHGEPLTFGAVQFVAAMPTACFVRRPDSACHSMCKWWPGTNCPLTRTVQPHWRNRRPRSMSCQRCCNSSSASQVRWNADGSSKRIRLLS